MPNLNGLVGNHRRRHHNFNQMATAKSHSTKNDESTNSSSCDTKSVLPIGDDEFADYEKIERVHLVDELAPLSLVGAATVDYNANTTNTKTTKTNLRVIIVTESFHPYTSGIARRFKEIIERLAKRGYRIHVITGCKVRKRIKKHLRNMN